ncbi:PAS domain S-box protein [Brevibacillus dissolubilis]|uniref:PAS domain S-box protein n=1 Tax=Brevibacillus dissolubilis TaxID=1844116 RepID=UPI001116A1AE|nr:PAS domain S-box protein [Brevibacillus dissolubilis]
MESSVHVLFNHSPMGIGITDADGTIQCLNPTALRLLSCSAEEMTGKPIQRIFPCLDWGQITLRLTDAPEESVSIQQEICTVNKAKTFLPLDVHISVDHSKSHTRYVIFFGEWKGRDHGFFHSLFAHNPHPVYSVDTEGRFTSANEACERVFGYPADALLGKKYQDFLSPKEALSAISRLEWALQGGSNESKVEVISSTGERLYLHVISFPRFIHNEIDGVYVIARDVTRESLTEQALEHARRELQDTLQQQKGMTFKFREIDGKYTYTMAYGELLYRLGLRPETVIGKTPQTLNSELRPKDEYYRRAMAGENVTYEDELNGVCYVATLRPIYQNGGVAEVIASCVDITERKRAEEELRATKDLLESFFTNTTDAIDVIDLDGRIVQINKAYERMYGWSAEEAIGQPLMIVPPEYKLESKRLSQEVLTGQQVSGYETIRQRKDGQLLHVSLTLSPIRDASGQVIGTAAITRDISEKKRTEELLVSSEKLSAIGELAAGVAHEIRNPLTALRGFVQLLHSMVKQHDEYFDIMLTELDRINFIVSELLVLAKPQVVSFQKRDLHHLLHHVITLLDTQAIMSNVQMFLQIEKDLPLITCEENQLKQVFINILRNGIDSMADGGQIHIKVSTQADERIVLHFIDQGCGIPEERIPKLGQPFYSTKEKGTGLGLMVSQKIIRDHQGTMNIASEVGKGTTVTITLPLVVSPAAASIR